jgi:hypothetical protein
MKADENPGKVLPNVVRGTDSDLSVNCARHDL